MRERAPQIVAQTPPKITAHIMITRLCFLNPDIILFPHGIINCRCIHIRVFLKLPSSMLRALTHVHAQHHFLEKSRQVYI